MRNKELVKRRMERLNGLTVQLRSTLNKNDIVEGRKLVQQILDLEKEISGIIERED